MLATMRSAQQHPTLNGCMNSAPVPSHPIRIYTGRPATKWYKLHVSSTTQLWIPWYSTFACLLESNGKMTPVNINQSNYPRHPHYFPCLPCFTSPRPKRSVPSSISGIDATPHKCSICSRPFFFPPPLSNTCTIDEIHVRTVHDFLRKSLSEPRGRSGSSASAIAFIINMLHGGGPKRALI